MSIEGRYKKWKQDKRKEPTSQSGSFGSRYTAWKMKNDGAGVADGIASRVNTWLKNNDNYVSNYQKRFSGRTGTYKDVYVNDSADYYSTVLGQKQRFDTEAENIRSLLSRYGDYLDADWVNDVLSALDTGGKYQSEIVSAAKRDGDFWSQFGGVGDYQAWQTESGYRDKYGQMSYSDLMKELEALEADGKTDTDAYSWLTAYAPQTMTAEDYDSVIAEKKNRIAELESLVEGIAPKEAEVSYKGKTASEIKSNAWSSLKDNKKAWESEQTKDLRAELESLEAEVWDLEKRRKYNFLEDDPDFDKISASVADERTQGLGIGFGSAWLGMGDPTYDYINDINGARNDLARMGSDTSYNPYARYDHMTDGEIARYNYIYNTEGESSAKEYLDWLEHSLNERETAKAMASAEALAKKSPVIASAVSVPINLISGVGAVDIALQNVKKGLTEAVTGEYAGPIDYNTPAASGSAVSSAVRGTVAQTIADKTGVISIDEKKNPILARIFNGKSLGDVYQLGMSMADSLAAAGLSPLMGSAGSSSLLAGSAATQGMLDAAANGATDEQALFMGILNGTAEYFFEKYEVETLLSGWGAHLLRNIF